MQVGDAAEVEIPTLAAFLKQLRLRRGWTQRVLAQQVYLGIGTVQKLEQGDKVGVGDRALTVLADAICDDEHERAHLRALAGRPDLTLGEAATAADIERLLDQLAAIPAAWLVDWRIVVANATYRRLWTGLPEAESIAHWMFTDPRAQHVLPEWRYEAEVVVGLLRHYWAAEGGDGVTGAMVRELATASAEFREFWDSGVVYVRRPEGPRYVRSGDTGAVIPIRESLIPAAAGWLVIGL
ncbi:helix-turn-helix transcriptional regulator [Nocardia sp. NPDC059240]|uniref:helix-turn-helix transcriptional regulator n=1 Tax=Nocardia sp. NPDC059240 TaxID=3346786 RepID=UPI0036C5D475